MDKKREIWIYAEFNHGKIMNVFEELLSHSRNLFSNETTVCAVILAHDADEKAKDLMPFGPDKIYAVKHNALENYNCDYYKSAMSSLIKKYHPNIVLFGATVKGAELAPSVAADIRTGLAAHCVDITADNTTVSYWVPAFGGNVIGEILIPEHTPQMASVKPGILEIKEYIKNDSTEIIIESFQELDSYDSKIELLDFDPKETTTQALEASEVIVCAGRGITTEETWLKLNEFAKKIGAGVGYTRSLIDRGYTEDETGMIGTSGKSVSPKIYIGIGVSGATHHVCGMNKSKTIIAVNKDPNAKIFDISDYRITANGEEILDALLERL